MSDDRVSGFARRWADVWQRAWEAGDVEAIVALYHPEAVFSTQPFRVPYRGREGVREYVAQAFAEEQGQRVWVGSPLVDAERAAIEWWATLIENRVEITLAGTSVLTFDGAGLVVEQRDTWNQAGGLYVPPLGWGT